MTDTRWLAGWWSKQIAHPSCLASHVHAFEYTLVYISSFRRDNASPSKFAGHHLFWKSHMRCIIVPVAMVKECPSKARDPGRHHSVLESLMSTARRNNDLAFRWTSLGFRTATSTHVVTTCRTPPYH